MTRAYMNIHEHATTIYLWVSCSHLHVQPLLSVGSFMTSWLGRRASPCRSLAGTRWVMPQPGGIEIALMGPLLEEFFVKDMELEHYVENVIENNPGTLF